ncbi:MAG: queuosine precursor transporter [Alphaproteobacteria bacterium]
MNQLPETLVMLMNGLPTVAVSLIMILVAFSAVLIMLRLFGEVGLYLFVVIGIIAANLLVLKIVKFPFYTHPVALGTELFAITYLCTDILSEYFSKEHAKKAVWLGFSSFFVMTILMMIGMGYAPVSLEMAGAEMGWAVENHDHIKALFLPAPAIFIASMAAYLTSQFHDIWCFKKISQLTNGRYLWLRNNVSTAISALIDNIIFSTLAWVVLSPNPVETKTLIFTYILGTYLLRLAISVLDTPFIYLARFALPPEMKAQRQNG